MVGTRKTFVPYGVCGADAGLGTRCIEPMLLPDDARFVLRKAIAHERGGGNAMSEYDL